MSERSEQKMDSSKMQENFNTHGERVSYLDEKAEPSFGELFVVLSDDLSTLIHKEIELARIEMGEKVTQTTGGLIRIALGGIFVLLGAGALLAAAILLLGAWVAYWISASMFGVLVVLIGLIMIQSGRVSLSSLTLLPQQTVASIQKDRTIMKERIQL